MNSKGKKKPGLPLMRLGALLCVNHPVMVVIGFP